MKRRNFLLKSAEFLGLGALVATGVVKAGDSEIDPVLDAMNEVWEAQDRTKPDLWPVHEDAHNWWRNGDIEELMRREWVRFEEATGHAPDEVRLGVEAYAAYTEGRSGYYTREDRAGFPTIRYNQAPVYLTEYLKPEQIEMSSIGYTRWEDVPLKAKDYACEVIKTHNGLLKNG